MKKNIILVLLAILLIASIGWAWFLQQEKNKLQEGMKTLEVEKTALQNKIEKGLVYAKALDTLLEPVRKEASLPTRQNLSDIEWLSALIETTKSTADTQLQSNVNDIKGGGDTASRATVLFLEHAVSAIVDVLK
ncbi:hypothetical protein MUP06_02680 [Patescibacteria group bacterium]|nr:hypothetical protein [Patescibacteria group bacterium]